jgi:hypothetical protein
MLNVTHSCVSASESGRNGTLEPSGSPTSITWVGGAVFSDNWRLHVSWLLRQPLSQPEVKGSQDLGDLCASTRYSTYFELRSSVTISKRGPNPCLLSAYTRSCCNCQETSELWIYFGNPIVAARSIMYPPLFLTIADPLATSRLLVYSLAIIRVSKNPYHILHRSPLQS